VLDEEGQGLVELFGVLVRQVDLVGTVVQREGHRPDRVRAIDVADEPHGRLLCQCALPSMVERLKESRPILRTMLTIRNFPAPSLVVLHPGAPQRHSQILEGEEDSIPRRGCPAPWVKRRTRAAEHHGVAPHRYSRSGIALPRAATPAGRPARAGTGPARRR
jgi:hypothetical protein